MESKTCAFTGHRNIPADKIEDIRKRLKEELQCAIEDGYSRFLSGFADGADLLMAEVVVELKEKYPNLFLEAAIPYRNRISSGDKRFKELLRKCNGVNILSEAYFNGCFMLRNRYLVEQSGRVIAVYDGRGKGGTVFTMRHAQIMERDVRIVQY